MPTIETKSVRPSAPLPASPAAAPTSSRAQAAAPGAADVDAVVADAPRAARQVKGSANPVLQLKPPADDGPRGCARTPAPADRPRRLVVSHPFDAAGERSGTFEVLDVSRDGALSRPGRKFTMGTTAMGTIDFTPDGKVGLVALDDGKIGVFRLDADGKPTVVHEGFSGNFYAGKVVVEPRGDRALVIDRNWAERGGGIHQVTIGCDGTLTEHGRILAAKAPGAVVFSGDKAVVAAAELGKQSSPEEGEGPRDSVHLMTWGQTPAKIAGADAFGHNSAIVGGAAMTSDGKTLLIGDVNGFSGKLNQVAAVDVREDGLKARGGIAVDDPEAIATSPFGKVAVVASPLTDSIYVLDANTPDGSWQVRGQVPYRGARPQLPADLATIDQGALRGHVFVSENVSVRHLAFKKDGSVVDLGSLELGSDLPSVNGAIGVTK